MDEQSQRDIKNRALQSAQKQAINHFLQAAGVTNGRPLYSRCVARLLGIHEQAGVAQLRHPLIPTTAAVYAAKPGLFAQAIAQGSVGALASYARGDWTTDDLYAVMQYLMFADRVASVLGALVPLSRRKHFPQVHDQSESSLHYDLAPDLFHAITGGLGYSATRLRFSPDKSALASSAHYERLLDQVGLSEGHVLDLGCGWGAFTDYLIAKTSVSVTCVTLSKQQFAFLSAKYCDETRVTPVLADFRHLDLLPESAQLVALFESIEHLSIADRAKLITGLKTRYPKATVVVQTTCRTGFAARARSDAETALNGVVFPGPGTLATRAEIRRIARSAGYSIRHEQEMTAEYAHTALLWAQRVEATSADDLDLPETVLRIFVFYLYAMSASLACRRVSSNVFILQPSS